QTTQLLWISPSGSSGDTTLQYGANSNSNAGTIIGGRSTLLELLLSRLGGGVNEARYDSVCTE
ncbi:hypothetical protein ACFLX9_03375, partial [Chloroflexota bacterium]